MKTIIKRIIGSIAFFAVLLSILISMGQLFVPNERFYDLWEKYYSEPRNSIDVVFIGSSAMYRYWIPPQAYEEGKLTSAMIAGTGQPYEATVHVIEETAKTQNPTVYVVEVRKLIKSRCQLIDGTYDTTEPDYANGRMISGMKPSLTRFRAAADLMSGKGLSYRIEWMFPILKFHDNVFEFSPDVILKRIPRVTNIYKYAAQISVVTPFQEPQPELDANYALTQEDKEALDTVVRKAEAVGAKVLFLSTPFIPKDSAFTVQTQLAEYMAEKGYDYLNLQDYTDEMEIDFATDFYNADHFNINGAQKSTHFVTEYLLENYHLPDTHSAEVQTQWRKASKKWQKKSATLMEQWAENVEKARESQAESE